MLSVYRMLSTRYLSRRWFRSLLIVACIALGVGTLVATQALNDTMMKASLDRINPMPGQADLVVSYGDLNVPADLAVSLRKVPGVKDAWPRLFGELRIPALDRSVLIIGIDKAETSQGNSDDSKIRAEEDKDLVQVLADVKRAVQKYRGAITALLNFASKEYQKKANDFLDKLAAQRSKDEGLQELFHKFITPVYVGAELAKDLDQREAGKSSLERAAGYLVPDYRDLAVTALKGSLPEKAVEDLEKLLSRWFVVKKGSKDIHLLRIGTLKGEDEKFAFLVDNNLFLDLPDAAKILGRTDGKVNQIDVNFKPGVSKKTVTEAVKKVAKGHGEVRTPEEHSETKSSAVASTQRAFSLGGVAALVVGLFLVYNALAVCVAERRHEIGVLLSVGAMRRQIHLLFAGEAAFLGLAGSLIGIPLGWGLANLVLEPCQDILKEYFASIEVKQINLSWPLIALAMACGLLTSVVAALIPAVNAARENPASAVRQVSKAPTWSHLSWQVAFSFTLIAVGAGLLIIRGELPGKVGLYSGMILVLLGELLISPVLAALIARMLKPVARRFFPITWRLAADNLVLSPGRTGLVIAALAAGVALVLSTYGIIVSTRTAFRESVRETIASDLIVTSGPVGAGGPAQVMKESLGAEMEKIKGVEAALPRRSIHYEFGNTQIMLVSLDAARTFQIQTKHNLHLRNTPLYGTLSERSDTAIVSENFAARNGVGKGDFIPLNAGGVQHKFMIIGTMPDFSHNNGAIFINRSEYKKLFGNTDVDQFDVYVKPGADVKAVQAEVRGKIGLEGLVMTRAEMQSWGEEVIERFYRIALAQQYVVMFVAALGVITALLISVLQRRREMGLLRAIGASQNQIVRSVLAEACLMGIIGTVIGVIFGIPLQWFVLNVLMLEESGNLFPMHVPWLDGLIIALIAMGAATLAGLGPALYSVRMRIPEAIAYE